MVAEALFGVVVAVLELVPLFVVVPIKTSMYSTTGALVVPLPVELAFSTASAISASVSTILSGVLEVAAVAAAACAAVLDALCKVFFIEARRSFDSEIRVAKGVSFSVVSLGASSNPSLGNATTHSKTTIEVNVPAIPSA